MNLARARFALALALFLGWLGYLGYLVAERPNGQSVLSRPQFLVSEYDVVADATPGSNVVTVKRVLWPQTADARKLEGKQLTVVNLDECRPPSDVLKKERPDLTTGGEYLLPVQSMDEQGKEYRVAPTPPSPGFPRGTPRIYRFSKEVEAEYRSLDKK
jgi:hypothetical protein